MASLYRAGGFLATGFPGKQSLQPRISNIRTAANQAPRRRDGNQEDITPPSFSMGDLGMSRTAKIVVYSALAIVGTAETITYGTWAWYKLSPKDAPDSAHEDS